MSRNNAGAYGALILANKVHAPKMLAGRGPGRYAAACGRVVEGVGVEPDMATVWAHALTVERCGRCATSRPNAWAVRS